MGMLSYQYIGGAKHKQQNYVHFLEYIPYKVRVTDKKLCESMNK